MRAALQQIGKGAKEVVPTPCSRFNGSVSLASVDQEIECGKSVRSGYLPVRVGCGRLCCVLRANPCELRRTVIFRDEYEQGF